MLLADLGLGFVAGLASSIPMLGPVVLLLLAAGSARELAAGRLLALTAAASEAVHVALAALGLGPLLVREPWVSTGLRVVSGLVLITLAVLAWRGARADAPATRTRALPRSPWAAAGLGVALVLPNPGFLVVWIAIVGGLEGAGIRPGVGFVAGAALGIAAWFALVLAAAARWGPRLAERHGRALRRVLALAFVGLAAVAIASAL